MTFIWYAGTPSDFGAQLITVTARDAGDVGSVSYDDMLQAAAVTLDIYTDRDTGSTLLDDLSLTDVDGTGVNQISGTVGEVIWFRADNTVTGDKTLYGTPDSGTTWYAFHPHNQELVGRVETLEGASSGTLGELSDVSVAGASDGQVLTYNAGTTTWAPGTASGSGLPSGGTTGQHLVKQSGTAGDADWETHYTVPAGGSAGDALVKTDGTAGNTEWDGTILRYEVVADQAAWEASAQTAGVLYVW